MSPTFESTCPLNCWDLCGLNVTVENNKVIDIKGQKNHRITKGFICQKGKKFVKRIYDSDRLTNPLLKGNESWNEISWDKAIKIISSKLQDCINNDSRSILFYSDSAHGGVLKNLESRFFNALGNVTVPRGTLCWSAGMKAQDLDFGLSVSHDYSDILNSNLVLIWGRNPSDTSIHQMYYIKLAQKNGTKVIVIDPRKTRTAKQADEYISLKPGTDGALALAMANHIITNNYHDNKFISRYVKGFKTFKKHIEKYTPKWASKETGIDENKIKELAYEYANLGSSSILIGYGIQRYTNSANTVRSIDSLAAITGNIGIPGGGANYANKQVTNFIDIPLLTW
ncbi:molybdopterin-dependent oxidoreductase [Natranaerobius trueperi]|nr:molybdopterin-dependent oxidoreductase [Natranaerobius trueperi]